MRRADFLRALAAFTAMPVALGSGAARAQGANKPVTIVVGYPAGGSTDVLARLYADALAARLGVPVLVINRPGAGSRIAAADVKRAVPDGATLLFTNASPLVIYPHIYNDLAYDPPRDFAPVSVAARTDLVLSVGPAVPASVITVKDYLAWVRVHPDQSSFGAVQGTSPHFAGQAFASAAGVDLRLIPYKGGAQAITDLLGGHVPAAVTALGEARPFEREGGLRMLALMSARRSELAPKVPSMAESGFATIDFPGWIGLVAPAHTPPEVIDRLAAAIGEIAKQPKVIAQIHATGLEPEASSPAAFRARIDADTQNYRKAVALTGFKAQD